MTEIKKLSKEWFIQNETSVQKENAKKLKDGYDSEQSGIFSKKTFLGKLSDVKKAYNKLDKKEELHSQKNLIDAFGGIETLHSLFDIDGNGKVTSNEIEEIASINIDDIDGKNGSTLSSKDLRTIYENVMDAEASEVLEDSALNMENVEETVDEEQVLTAESDESPKTITSIEILSLKNNTLDAKSSYMKAPVGSKLEAKTQQDYVESVLNWANAVISKEDASEFEINNVIKEVKYIQKYKSPAVVNMVIDSKPCLIQLNDKYKAIVAPKNKVLMARSAYMKAPVGSKLEAKTQKDYVGSVLNWANDMLSKTNPTQEELENVIGEMKYIQKYQSPAVVDMVKSSQPLLIQLNDKFDKLVAPRRAAIHEQLDGVFDEETANNLAKASKKRAGDRTKSTSRCAQYVRLAFEDAGILGTNELVVGSAKDLKTAYPKTGVFTEINVESIGDLKLLPPGCVIVWQGGEGFGEEFAKHGHVAVTQTDGKATTDYNQLIKDYGTNFTVFVPTLKTIEQKAQDVEQAKNELKDGTISGKSGTSKYLNRCIKYADAVIKDGNSNEDIINGLKDLLTNAIKSNKYTDLRPMVIQMQKQLKQINTININK